MNRLSSAFAAATLGLLIVSCTGESVDYTEPIVTPQEPSEPTVPTVDLSGELTDVAPSVTGKGFH